jgi:uncharacterized surface protein with fasciclin (FAS1) repeats
MKLSMRHRLAGLVVAPVLLMGVTAEAADDLATAAAKTGKHNQLVHTLRLTGLESTLRGPGTYTIFAPSDEAFGKLPKGVLFKLLQPENKQLLTAVLNYHVVAGDYPVERLNKARAKQFALKTAEGASIEVDTRNAIKAAQATVAPSGIKASNGTILPVDAVLIPPKVKATLASKPFKGS